MIFILLCTLFHLWLLGELSGSLDLTPTFWILSPYFLALQDALGSFRTLSATVPDSALLQGALVPFIEEWY